MKWIIANSNQVLFIASILAVTIGLFWPRGTEAEPRRRNWLSTITLLLALAVFGVVLVSSHERDLNRIATQRNESSTLGSLTASLDAARTQVGALQSRNDFLEASTTASKKDCAELARKLCGALREAADKVGRYEVLGDGTVNIQLKESSVTFKTDQADLSPEDMEHLSRLAGILSWPIALDSIKSIELVGHTDNVGTARHNEQLSLARAKSVEQYLIRSGISTLLLLPAEGKGSRQPFPNQKHADADDETVTKLNATSALKALNRRVDVLIKKVPSTLKVVGCDDSLLAGDSPGT